MQRFIETIPTNETLWRAIILFGRNVASYKFALGKALLELADEEITFIKLEDLANPFSKHLTEHLKITDTQGTSSSSQFLDACRQYNNNEISKDDLISKTVALGFNNVIDAFHIVNRAEVPKRFFIDERKEREGIIITDDLLKLKEQIQFINLPFEVEARWRLVETAWSLNLNPKLLEVKYDSERNLFFAQNELSRRINITSSRDSLNGYQKGKCFYCFKEIVVDGSDPDRMADVEHFFPHVLAPLLPQININGVWNLVLSCKECNRGEEGKFERVPVLNILERLNDRNEYLIDSHHPLRQTLINQTGLSPETRRLFLQNVDSEAVSFLIHRWEPKHQYDHTF